jgi:hypothetical protein
MLNSRHVAHERPTNWRDFSKLPESACHYTLSLFMAVIMSVYLPKAPRYSGTGWINRTPLWIAVFLLMLMSDMRDVSGDGRTPRNTINPTWYSLNDGPTNQTKVTSVTDAAGLLHVITRRATSSTTQGYDYFTIAPTGTISGPATIVDGWTSLNYPSLVLRSNGSLALYFSGIRTTSVDDPYGSGRLYRTESDISRTTWTLDPTIYPSSNSVYVVEVDADVSASGVEVVAHPADAGLSAPTAYNVNTGVLAAATSQGCCSYFTSIKYLPSTDQFFVGWFSNATSLNGYFFQQISPTTGTRLYAPGSANDDLSSARSPNDRVPLVLRQNALYTAYCVGYIPCSGLRVWQVGTESTFFDIPNSADASNISLATDGTRLWAAWTVDNTLYVSRSNATLTAFSQPREVVPPTGTGAVYRTYVEASRGHLDLFVNTDGLGEVDTKYARIGVPLDVSAKPKKLSRNGGKLRITVTDGDSPIEGATVRLGGRTFTTNSEGIVNLRIKAGRAALRMTAEKVLYSSTMILVKRKN